MRLALALAVALLLPATAGCIDRSVERVRDVVGRERTDPMEFAVLVNQTFAFDIGGGGPPPIPPAGPSDLAHHGNVTFDVPIGALDLNVTAVVVFDNPVPGPLPKGDVTLRLLRPDDTGETREGIQQPSAHSWESPTPAPGTWVVLIEAGGRGSVRVTAEALVPLHE